MKKRWICGLLAAVILLGLSPSIRATASEGSTDPTETVSGETDPTESTPEDTEPTEPPPEEDTPMTVSEELIEVLKTMEGFSPVAYWDYSQWTIGYGTRCPEGKEHYYTVDNPFPEEEAEALLLEELSYFEEVIRGFAEKYSLELQQQQFDALVSFSYNCGGNWVNDTAGYLNTAVREGDMSNRLIYGMCLWSSAGGDYILIDRRKCEANMYINGVYKAYNTTGGVPSGIKHVFLDGNGGTPRYVIHGYNADDPAGIVTEFKTLPTGTDSSGNTFTYRFAGWYTAASGGTQVTVLDGSLSNGTVLYAHWKDPQGNVVTLPKGTVIDGVTVTVTASGKIRTGPGTYYPVVKTVSDGETLTITETFQSGGTLWGKCEYGWISLYYTDYDEVISGGSTDPDDPEGQWGTVTTKSGGTVNVRSGPGTSYGVVGVKETGDRVQIFARQSDGSREWGQMADGNWICLDYVTFDVTLQSISVASGPTKTQYVQKQDSLSLAGSALTLLYSDGSTETIGITADMVSGFSNEELGNVTVTVTYEGKTASFTVTVIKATVVFKNYDGTVLSSAQYAYGETVRIPANPTRPAEEDCVYRFTGWDKTVTACAGDAVYTAVYEAIQGRWGTVRTKSGGPVNVRSGPGTSYDKVGVKETGERVQIFARQSDGSREWGQMADGNWICLDYVTFDVTLQSISVASGPTKTQYVQKQDSLSLAGSALTLLYSDGSTETIGITADMVSGFSNEELGNVTVTVTYEGKTASFTVTVIKATVVFKNYDGTVLSSAQYAYGETVKIPANPTRPAEEDCIYRFTGWDKTVTACAGDAVYTAVYEAIQGRWGTVRTKSGGPVNVRSGPGTSYDKVGVKEAGDRVQIFARQSDGSREWGQMADGNWICLDYVSFDSTSGSLTGDFDGSGAVNEDDAIYLLRYVIFPENYPINGGADFTGDGKINEDDAIYLLRHVIFPEDYPLNPS